MCKAFFDTLPNELLEAGKIDGASDFGIFYKIVLPLSKPVVSVNILNTFIVVYNQFAFPIMLLPKEENWTMMIRIYVSLYSPNLSWNKMMIMLTVATIPVIVAYLIAQKNVIQGISTTGLKG